MFNFDGMIRASLASVGERDVAVAFPYDRPKRVLEILRAEGLIKGWVADSQSDFGDGAIGWWRDRRAGNIHLEGRSPETLALVGVDPRFQAASPLIEQLASGGFGRLVTTRSDGSVIHSEDLRSSRQVGHSPGSSGSPPALHDFDAAFRQLLASFGSRLEAPPKSFDPNRLLIAVGTLNAGGAERQASMLAAELARCKKYDVYVACHFLEPPNDFFRPVVEAAGATVVQVPQTCPETEDPVFRAAVQQVETDYPALGLTGVLYEIARYAHLLRKLKIGIAHTWMDYHNVLGGLAASLVRVPRLVLSGRSVAPDHFTIFQPYMKAGYRALLARRNVTVLNNSNAGARDYERWLELAPHTIKTIHNGFHVPAIDPSSRTSERARGGVSGDQLVVGSILRFSEEKRPGFLVEIAKEIARQRPNIVFRFFGDGPLRAPLIKKIEALGLSDRIKLPGHTSNSFETLAGFDLFMLTSRMEGLPNVLIEAQLAGVPVLCSGVGGMMETFLPEKSGYAVAGESAAAFAQRALDLLDDRERLQSMSKAAMEFSRANFSIARTTSLNVQAYERSGL